MGGLNKSVNNPCNLWLIKNEDRRHEIAFFERVVPYYAAHRDLVEMPGVELDLYNDWHDISSRARHVIAESDVAVVTSYCPDGIDATELVASSNVNLSVFYDLDTPITLEALQNGEPLAYIGPHRREETRRRIDAGVGSIQDARIGSTPAS